MNIKQITFICKMLYKRQDMSAKQIRRKYLNQVVLPLKIKHISDGISNSKHTSIIVCGKCFIGKVNTPQAAKMHAMMNSIAQLNIVTAVILLA